MVGTSEQETFAYCDRLDYAPGDTVRVHASSGSERLRVSLVRPRADGDTERIRHRHEPVAAVEPQETPGSLQPTGVGSFGLVEGLDADVADGLTVVVHAWPTRFAGDRSTLLSLTGDQGTVELTVDADGMLTGRVRTGDGVVEVVAEAALQLRQWVTLALSVDPAGGMLRLHVRPLDRLVPGDLPRTTEASGALAVLGPLRRLLLAAGGTTTAPDGSPRGTGCFDGKLDSPTVLAGSRDAHALADLAVDPRPHAALLAWDLGTDFATTILRGTTDGAEDGLLVNAPTRNVTGRWWDATEVDHRLAPGQYGAAHFHSDDLEDCGWAVTHELVLPDDLASGVYAVLVEGSGSVDHVPVVVRPQAPGGVLFLLPTFSYLAYANARLAEEFDYSGDVLTNRDVIPSDRDRQIYAHREFGSSLYDHHTDGSGVCYSSHLRPILNMRWDFRSAIQDAPRHFAADLVIPTWLEHLGLEHSVTTDHALHEQGLDALAGHRVLVTGSHPEYWSKRMLDAAQALLDDGGSIVYLGGNGFYWVTSADLDRPHLVEMRRGHQGIRTWQSEPGETVMSQSVEEGGLWRLRGRAPNLLVGIGMAAQGWDDATPGFERTEASRDERVAFLFEGVDRDVIGDYGLVLGGAAGDEIDRADVSLGTPRNALVVATSQPHSAYYLASNENVPAPTPLINGTNNPDVRADVTFFETPAGGAVLSTAAISWTGSLAYDGFDNDVARLTENGVRELLARSTSG
ncbi:N,N-dimethylformamidase beta subunit family domain-containing protein [Nocardioides lijunqiniae]|uniref:N,N-dimethylformamidase beta subunit family domain-containing protein n=1 Tax=Nocardioides lijunqiniae TaxID=2760832 RepID=UPI0018776ACE|nr:N,N-dimethylformamidase beta subunit family domain-containing protein [Nocardioides lijunqiniae]